MAAHWDNVRPLNDPRVERALVKLFDQLAEGLVRCGGRRRPQWKVIDGRQGEGEEKG